MSLFSFIILTDSHVSGEASAEDDFFWNRILVSLAPEILRNAVARINSLAVDFVVHCGDLTNDGFDASFRVAADILRKLDAPLYFVPGNHDTQEPESRRALDEAFNLNGAPAYCVKRIAGWRLLFVDAAYWTLKDGSVADYRVPDRFVNMSIPEMEMNWLRSELDSDCSSPTLCFMHPYPAIREAYPVKRLAGPWSLEAVEGLNRGSLACTAKLKETLKKYPCVKGVFSGHGHWHECITEDDILFCQTGALADYPCEMRLVRVSNDALETEVLGLSDEQYAQRSYMEEVGNRWPAGRDNDRSMTRVL